MTKVKTVRMCRSEGCTFTTTSVKELQKHYEQDHDMKERVKGSLVISGHDYLPISGKPIHHKEKFLAGAIFILLGMFMITAPSLNLIYAADEQGSSGDSGGGGDSGGSNDGGGESNSNDGGGGEDSKDSSSSNQGSKQDADDNGQVSNDNADDNSDNSNKQPTSIKTNDGKGTPEEQEKAAQEDYIFEEPGIIKPYPSADKISGKPIPGSAGIPKLNLLCSHTKEGCNGKGKGDGWGDGDGWNKGGDGDKGKGKGDWCHWHKCDDGGHHSKGDHNHHHDHDHNYHNDKHHYDSHTNKYYYYYSNDYSNNHATVILQLDYHGTNDIHDVNIEIGNDFDATFNLAGEPENLVITGLDLDNGENFDVCIENDGNVNCEKGHINNQNDVDYVDIRVP